MTWFAKGTNCRLSFLFPTVQDGVSTTWYSLGLQCSHLTLRTFLTIGWTYQALEVPLSGRASKLDEFTQTNDRSFQAVSLQFIFCSGFSISISSFPYKFLALFSLWHLCTAYCIMTILSRRFTICIAVETAYNNTGTELKDAA